MLHGTQRTPVHLKRYLVLRDLPHGSSNALGRQVLGHVGLTDDSDDFAVIDDRQATDLMLRHQISGVLQRVVRTEGDHLALFEVARARLNGVLPPRYDVDDDVPIGKNAFELLAIVADRQYPDVFTGQTLCGFANRFVFTNHHDVLGHNLRCTCYHETSVPRTNGTKQKESARSSDDWNMKRLLMLFAMVAALGAAPDTRLAGMTPQPASAADYAPCDALHTVASVLGTSGTAGTIYEKIALINTDGEPCVMPAFPTLHLTAGSASFSPVGSGRAIVVPHGGSAIVPFGWSDVDTRGTCGTTADLEIALRNEHLPLWVPVAANACDLRQLPVHLGPQGLAPPGMASAGAHYEHWFEAQPCESRMLWLSTHAQPVPAAHPDTLTLKLPPGSTIDANAYVGMAIAKPVTIAFDASTGTVAESTPFGHNAMLCSRVSSTPYGVARVELFARTALGIAIGTPQSLVEQREGPAAAQDLGSGYSALEYTAKQNGVTHLLTVLLYRGKTYAIAYSQEH
jgi:hypothetical protein